MSKIRVGDKVRTLTRDEYDKAPATFRHSIHYDLHIWTREHDTLVVKGIAECEMHCGGHGDCNQERFDLGHNGMHTMCGGIYRLYKKNYSWKKL